MTLSLDLSAQRGEFALQISSDLPLDAPIGVFGPSGSGKSTLLRSLCGLEKTLTGSIVFDGESWLGRDKKALPTPARGIGYVPQQPTLFPHLTVRENISYGISRSPARGNFPKALVERLGLVPLLDRHPSTLSGGEAQRVAIARAIACQPRLLLMDEPLSALDATSRDHLLADIAAVTRDTATPLIFVSHSARELHQLTRHLLVLQNGQLVDSGPTTVLLNAHAGDAVTFLDATASDHADGMTTAALTNGTVLHVPGDHVAGAPLHLTIAASDVSLALDPPSRTSILNVLPARISTLTSGGARTVVALEIDGTAIKAHISTRSARLLELAAGQHVYAQIKAIAIS